MAGTKGDEIESSFTNEYLFPFLPAVSLLVEGKGEEKPDYTEWGNSV